MVCTRSCIGIGKAIASILEIIPLFCSFGRSGLTDISLGVPCILGKNGIESIVEIALSDAEKEKLVASAAGVREVNNLLTV